MPGERSASLCDNMIRKALDCVHQTLNRLDRAVWVDGPDLYLALHREIGGMWIFSRVIVTAM